MSRASSRIAGLGSSSIGSISGMMTRLLLELLDASSATEWMETPMRQLNTALHTMEFLLRVESIIDGRLTR